MVILKRGKRGWRVKRLQKSLINLGYGCGSWGADGIFGPATERAVKKFQSQHKDSTGKKLVEDGIYGPKTQWAIRNPTRSRYTKIKPVPTPAGKKICVDPGHGGKDPGAIGADGTRESVLNLRFAKAFEKAANQAGFSVTMTRHSDTYPTLAGRARLANQRKCNLFISFHCNSATTPQAQGTEVYYWGTGQGRYSRTGVTLAQYVKQELVKSLHTKDRGFQPANFHVLRETKMTAILVEVGFISNEEEREFLKGDNIPELVARAVLKGVQRYYKLI